MIVRLSNYDYYFKKNKSAIIKKQNWYREKSLFDFKGAYIYESAIL